MHIETVSTIFLLLVIANGTPLIISGLLGQRFNHPVDSGRLFTDGRPWLGPAKTLRGLVSSILATAIFAPLLDLSPAEGAGFALLAMSGDLFSSFVKRRLGVPPSRSAPLLDQLPEALLPLSLMQQSLGATLQEIIAAILVFVVVDVVFSRLRETIYLR